MKILITDDGSPTLLNTMIDETYHSRHGARQESMHVFIHAGLKQLMKDPLHILEIGFGTGLNATLTALHCDQQNVHYTALEPHPVAIELLGQLHYFSTPEEMQLHLDIIHADFEKITSLSSHFHLKKLRVKIQEYATEEKYDLIYFDAFAPLVQPEMWTLSIFEQVFSMMNIGGIMVTYCAKGQVRRNLMAAGFSVERIAGPPGKREMLRATKKTS